jgi:dTDP-4-dehydrorhamnose reductase
MAVINAAAWTDMDAVEQDAALATRINAEAPAAMAQACAELGAAFVHLSSDCVFDGSGAAPWRPEDPPAPLSAYGRSKVAGERAVFRRSALANGGGRAVVLRTSWVFAAHGDNFVTRVLKRAEAGDPLPVVADQIGGPTPARDLAAICLTVADHLAGRRGVPGLHHAAGAPAVSRADFARAILEGAGLDPALVQPVPSRIVPRAAPRPANARLDGGSLAQAFGCLPPDWRAGLADVLSSLRAAP